LNLSLNKRRSKLFWHSWSIWKWCSINFIRQGNKKLRCITKSYCGHYKVLELWRRLKW